MKYTTVAFSSSINRSNFRCGNLLLDRYFKEQAIHDFKKKIAAIFIWLDENKKVIGFYSLSNDNIDRKEVPEEMEKKMPESFDSFPTTFLGKLAIDLNFQKDGNGRILLFDALKRACDNSKSSIVSMAVVVDPIDLNAQEFYTTFGFVNLPDRGRMLLPMKTINQVMG
ncbi:MAG: GNAT family N-acetyltransferase [Saprospiraceae bacterium]